MRKIVLLDDVYVSERQLIRFNSIGQTRVYKGTPKDDSETMSRIGDAEIVVLGWTQINEIVLNKLNHLKLIVVWATGYDNVDVHAATMRNIVVTNVPGYASIPVAELVFGLALALARQIINADRHVRVGRNDWKEFMGFELKGKALGVIGTGSIGSEVARIGNGFGMHVLGYTEHPSVERAKYLGLEYVEFDKLLSTSDIISIHTPLNKTTINMISDDQFRKMKRTTLLINTARAEIVHQKALVEALVKGTIRGAGLDVINSNESDINSLYELENVVLTPHIAFHTVEALERKTDLCLANLESFMLGTPENVVNPEVLNSYTVGGNQ